MNCKNKPKVIGISECRIKTGRLPLSSINMDNFSHEYTLTESSKSSLVYIDKNLRYKLRSGLIHYSKEIESTFIEIIEPTIVGCIYEHPNFPVSKFANDFLETLLEKLSFKKGSYSNGRLR